MIFPFLMVIKMLMSRISSISTLHGFLSKIIKSACFPSLIDPGCFTVK